MSSVTVRRQPFQMAWLQEENPLPDFQNVSYVHSSVTWDDTLGEEDVRYMRYGRVSSILPYLSQDSYTRERQETHRDVIVLENGRVRAEFLPWMGGRLWSLRCDGRELLSKNPVVQPCNLALRNAWCSGGVEWNVGVRGHNLLTCEALFAEALALPDGTQGVRLYQYERLRGIVYRIEAYLPPDSALLYVNAHIENPKGNGEIPMYWWSNIAVPEEPGTRVIAPAQTGVLSLYDAGRYRMTRQPLPVYENMDFSRPGSISRSVDVFYDVEGRPFIAALQGNQEGLVQFSTERQQGRKLFVWGMGQGGRHWQRFLSGGQQTYIEIQAGIAKTQQDHLPMPDGAVWEWLEAYGCLRCNVNGMSYPQAVDACRAALERVQTQEALHQEAAGRGREIAQAHGELISFGSGWGALEELRRRKAGMEPLSSICRFPETTLAAPQEKWRALLETGAFPEDNPLIPPESYLVAQPWRALLQAAPKTPGACYHLGVMAHAAGDEAEAQAQLLASVALGESPWAWRALARLSAIQGDREGCLERYHKALALLPDCRALCLEYAQTLLSFARAEALRGYLQTLPEALARQPRFLYLQAASAVELGEFDLAESILKKPLVIPDMCEGELSLCELWYQLYMKKERISRQEAERRFPLPEALDFRMHQ